MDFAAYWPQLICGGLMAVNAGIHLAKDGQPKRGSVNFLVMLISGIFYLVLLGYGGFWQEMHWPQWTYLALSVVGLAASAINHGQRETGTYSFGGAVIGAAIAWWLLWMGGFWG